MTDRDQCPKLGCTSPGSQPSCQLCPHSPTYWRLSPAVDQRAAAERDRVNKVEDR